MDPRGQTPHINDGYSLRLWALLFRKVKVKPVNLLGLFERCSSRFYHLLILLLVQGDVHWVYSCVVHLIDSVFNATRSGISRVTSCDLCEATLDDLKKEMMCGSS